MSPTADLTAIFSYAPGLAPMIAITPANDSGKAVATSRPAADARPLDALAAMGYRLAYPTQDYNLGPTMADTSYARLYVVRA
ncbi:hypothetical protein K1T35_47460 (plasmid) [Pseudonocardia sp. DSM 110487]|uniref:hypothetical protein n=1 Tax=Pseudonocardia sp. DSM 110487 TaxID=2865833 RepID=UPI001C6A7B01|nr:hypothetical protein [Pseudonocardia sp. DSM 110487]QYN40988.1 hypothetical protein K1T35_47460 [Pseudonocardia sp. DSM 110487]